MAKQPTLSRTALLRESGVAEAKPPPIRYVIYARKSTEAEEKQALSIDSQIKEMQGIAKRDGLEIIEIRRESHSAKESGQRPVFKQLLSDIGTGMFNGILTWAPDRLSRNAGDLGELVDLMDRQKLHEIRTYGQVFTNTPNEKFLLMILGSQAKLENDQKGLNVKRGLRARVEAGLWPGMAPTGYLNERHYDKRCVVTVDEQRAPIIRQMFEKVANDGYSGRKIYSWLKFDINFKTKNGKNLSLANIYRILSNPFYFGEFEYPRGSGSWYKGAHTPIISKELYEQVCEQITSGNKMKSENKEFIFIKLITCGNCGSGLTADEKFKRLKDGTVNRYVYYGCTRSRDINCKVGYIREEALIEQMTEIIDKVDSNKLGVKERISQELERLNKFRSGVLGENIDKKPKQKNIDIKNYAKYILREGSIYEKREILSNLRSQLVFKDKKLKLDAKP